MLPYNHLCKLQAKGVFCSQGKGIFSTVALNVEVVFVIEVLDEGMQIDFSLFGGGVEEEGVEEGDEDGLIGCKGGLGLEFLEEGDADGDGMVGMGHQSQFNQRFYVLVLN